MMGRFFAIMPPFHFLFTIRTPYFLNNHSNPPLLCYWLAPRIFSTAPRAISPPDFRITTTLGAPFNSSPGFSFCVFLFDVFRVVYFTVGLPVSRNNRLLRTSVLVKSTPLTLATYWLATLCHLYTPLWFLPNPHFYHNLKWLRYKFRIQQRHW